MSNVADSLLTTESTDRVHYETGVLLNDTDFIAEQTYHRGRLARVLQYLVGSGTAAGLRVRHEAAVEASEEVDAREERLLVEPGLAIDSFGRMIELPKHQCIRLDRWYQQQTVETRRQGWHSADVAWPGAPAGVTVDVGIRFISCERGKTPSFAVGPFDSIDAVTAERVRDSATVSLRIRTEATPPIPENPWPDISTLSAEDAATSMREAIFDAWQEGAPEAGALEVFLARAVIVADEPPAGEAPARDVSLDVEVNNNLRQFVVSTNALLRWFNSPLSQP